MNIGRVYTVALTGMHTDTVTVQGFISQGLPQFTIVGLPDAVLTQARERVKSACKTTNFRWPQTRNYTEFVSVIFEETWFEF